MLRFDIYLQACTLLIDITYIWYFKCNWIQKRFGLWLV